MALLADKLRKRGPDGALTEETPEEIQSLSGQMGLQAPPITPLGAAALGANPHQQKMMGAPNQKQAALTLATTPPSSSLQDALRRAQPRTQATSQEQGTKQKSEELQNLGGLGDRVSDFIEIQRKKLADQAAQATNTQTGVAVQAQDQFQGKDVSGVKSLLDQFRRDPSNQQLLLQVNEALGYDVNKQLSPQEVDQLYESAVNSISRGGAGNVDNDLTVDDLTGMPNFGYTPEQLSQLLNVPAAEIGKYSVGQLRAALDAEAAAEFSRTSGLEQQATSGQLGIAERGLARQGTREMSRVGVRSTEADVAQLEQQIQNADQVQFGGKSYKVDDLLKDDTISGIISEYMNSAPNSDTRKQLEQTEPSLIQFIQKNQKVLQDASTQMQAGATEFGSIQTSNKELQTAPFGGMKLDDSIAAALIPGFGKLQSSRVNPNSVPLLKYANTIGTTNGLALANELNTQISHDPSFADELKGINENHLAALGIEKNGEYWRNYKRQKEQYQTFQSLDPQNVDQLVSTMVGGVTGAGDAQSKLSRNYAQDLVFGGHAGVSPSIVDLNGDGRIDSGADLKSRLLEANPKADLAKAAANKSSVFEKQAIPPAKPMNDIQTSILRKLPDLTGVSKVTADMVDKAAFNLDELIYMQDNPASTVDKEAIDRNRYWGAVNNTKDLVDSVTSSGRSRPDQISELQNQLAQQGNRRLDEDRIQSRISGLAEDELNETLADSAKDREATRTKLRQNRQILAVIYPPFAALSPADQDAIIDLGSMAGQGFADQIKKTGWESGKTAPENLATLAMNVYTAVPRAYIGAAAGVLDSMANRVGPKAGSMLHKTSEAAKDLLRGDVKGTVGALGNAVSQAPGAVVEGVKSLGKKLRKI